MSNVDLKNGLAALDPEERSVIQELILERLDGVFGFTYRDLAARRILETLDEIEQEAR